LAAAYREALVLGLLKFGMRLGSLPLLEDFIGGIGAVRAVILRVVGTAFFDLGIHVQIAREEVQAS
jgi:hypothetical protein